MLPVPFREMVRVCRRLDSGHQWEGVSEGIPLATAIDRVNLQARGLALPNDLSKKARQQAISLLIDNDKYTNMIDSASVLRRAHLKTQAASSAEWLRAMPNKNLDKHLSNWELTPVVSDFSNYYSRSSLLLCPLFHRIK